MARFSWREAPKALPLVASSYLLSGAIIPWLVVISNPLSLCKGYCVLVTSQYAATASSYCQYVQIPHSATPLDMIEIAVSLLPLAAAIPALYFSILQRDQ
jgi:hypothetical protein